MALYFSSPREAFSPLAVSEYLYHRASCCALHMAKHAGIYVAPLQHTDAVKDDPTIVGQALQAAFQADLDPVIQSTDFHNTSNTTSCKSIRQKMLDNCSFLVWFFTFWFSQPSSGVRFQGHTNTLPNKLESRRPHSYVQLLQSDGT
jgi:hypothetical protein